MVLENVAGGSDVSRMFSVVERRTWPVCSGGVESAHVHLKKTPETLFKVLIVGIRASGLGGFRAEGCYHVGDLVSLWFGGLGFRGLLKVFKI